MGLEVLDYIMYRQKKGEKKDGGWSYCTVSVFHSRRRSIHAKVVDNHWIDTDVSFILALCSSVVRHMKTTYGVRQSKCQLRLYLYPSKR